MRRFGIVLALVVTTLLVACATPSECPAGTTCPVRIVNGFVADTYKADPDLVLVNADQTVGILWSIEDPKARFKTGGDPSTGDGVYFTKFDGGNVYDVSPCFPTDDGRTQATGPSASMYLCPFWSKSPKMRATYTIRFHDAKGVQRIVDPGVTNTDKAQHFQISSSLPLPWRPAITASVMTCNSSADCILQLTYSADPGGASISPTEQKVAASANQVILTWTLPDRVRSSTTGRRFATG